MFVEFTLDNIPGGFALNAGEKGQQIQVSRKRFITTDEGEILFKLLDGISSQFLNKSLVEKGMLVSQIDKCLITVTKDKLARIYVNDI